MAHEERDSQFASFDPRLLINIGLFALTLFTATVSGVQWLNLDPFELKNFHHGLEYSMAILFVLGAHEFGHYFAARYHRVKATLPFFIPFPPVPGFLNFGTLGAVIRTRSVVPSRKAMFDIGVAGPIAGFVATLIVLIYGLLTLPGPEFILQLHPDYDLQLKAIPGSQGIGLEFGQTLAFRTLVNLFTDPTTQFVPPMSEIYHYPALCVGWFGLFVTAMNLIPIGQFDGGHIVYTMFGERHKKIARTAFITLLVVGVPSVADILLQMAVGSLTGEPPGQILPFVEYSWSGWLLWALISYFLVKLYHPPVPDETPLDAARMRIGWSCLFIFAVSFSFVPFSVFY